MRLAGEENNVFLRIIDNSYVLHSNIIFFISLILKAEDLPADNLTNNLTDHLSRSNPQLLAGEVTPVDNLNSLRHTFSLKLGWHNNHLYHLHHLHHHGLTLRRQEVPAAEHRATMTMDRSLNTNFTHFN